MPSASIITNLYAIVVEAGSETVAFHTPVATFEDVSESLTPEAEVQFPS